MSSMQEDLAMVMYTKMIAQMKTRYPVIFKEHMPDETWEGGLEVVREDWRAVAAAALDHLNL